MLDTDLLLAIDPGKDTGWSLFSPKGALLDAGLGDPISRRGVHVIIERPQVYRGRASKGDPNDLITLAIQVGRYTERFEAHGCTVEHVLPHEWKGSVDPDVLCRRIVEALLPREREALFQVLAPLARKPVEEDLTAGRRHNVIDAVGLGKWSLLRTRAAVFSTSSV